MTNTINNSNLGMSIRRRQLEIAAALAIAALASTAHVQATLPPHSTGYMVEVHTADVESAGTDSLIEISLEVEPNLFTGPWRQDHCGKYNDHERNQWDRYFYPESTFGGDIKSLNLFSDGEGNKPGWYWDTIYVTRIDNDSPIMSWRWNNPRGPKGEIPWIYGGKDEDGYSFEYDGDWKHSKLSSPRPIPADLQMDPPCDDDMGPTTVGAIAVTFYWDATFSEVCPDEVFSLDGIQTSQPLTAVKRAGQTWRCEYGTGFEGVTPGRHLVARIDQFTGRPAECKYVDVKAGIMTRVDILPGRGCPQN